jgi:hypothetical protein
MGKDDLAIFLIDITLHSLHKIVESYIERLIAIIKTHSELSIVID